MSITRTRTSRRVLLFVSLPACVLVGTVFWRGPGPDNALLATATLGTLTAEVTTSGILRPVQSLTYRSPVAGRDIEIVDLVPEGTRVHEGDVLARVDTSDLQREVERIQQELRQAQLDLQTAETERQEAAANVRTVSEGEGALTVEETRTRFQLAQKKAGRLREEYEQLKPLLERGFLTREELSKTADVLDQAEEELALAKKRMDVTVQLTHPREKQRAAMQLAQKESQVESVRARVQDAESRLEQHLQLIKACTIYARRPGLVVYEEFLSASPRRKVRIGDRVSSSQGLVTIPEVNRMLMETSVTEAEVHRVHERQRAAVHLEAFPELRLTGTVARIGTLASSSVDHPLDEKRFGLVIELDPTDADLRPEMTARADIIVGAVPNALLVPVNAIFQEQGTFVVHVSSRSALETRRVTIGESNDRSVVITSGLREGEQLTLVEPAGGSSAAAAGSAGAQPVMEEGRNALQPH